MNLNIQPIFAGEDRMRKLFLILGIILLLEFTGFVFISRWLQEPPVDETGKSFVSATPVQPIREAWNIQQMKESLFDPALDVTMRENLTEKIELAQKAQQAVLESAASPAPKEAPVLPRYSMNSLMGEWQSASGIYEGSDGLVRPEDVTISNYWQGVVAGKGIAVLAGADASDPAQSILIVLTTELPDGVSTYQRLPLQEKAGKIRIVHADFPRLTLQSAEGRQWIFNVETLSLE